MKRHDLTGRRVGMLAVVSPAPSRQGRVSRKTRWNCVCDCGLSVAVDTADLARTDGRARVSCGCRNHLKGANSPHWLSPNAISISYWSALQSSARFRKIPFTLTIEDAYEIYIGQGGVCALSGRDIPLKGVASFDRVDSGRGYEIGNVQWLHKDINRLKSDWPEDEFIKMCRRVADHVGT